MKSGPKPRILVTKDADTEEMCSRIEMRLLTPLIALPQDLILDLLAGCMRNWDSTDSHTKFKLFHFSKIDVWD
jgi:hypothetical protein